MDGASEAIGGKVMDPITTAFVAVVDGHAKKRLRRELISPEAIIKSQ
jgi:hypothetical protein